MRRPNFKSLAAVYPRGSQASFDALLGTPSHWNTCAMRLSLALHRLDSTFYHHRFRGNLVKSWHGIAARGSRALANYLRRASGWTRLRPTGRTSAIRDYSDTQGIIFWRRNPGLMNHIDLWDPARRDLDAVDNLTMLWAPKEGEVNYIWYWPLPR